MPTIEETTEELLQLASKEFQIPREQLSPDDDIYMALGIDSLNAGELIVSIDEHFGIELPDYEVQHATSFRSLVSRIQARL